MEIIDYDPKNFSDVFALVELENNSVWTAEGLKSSLALGKCLLASDGGRIVGFVLWQESLFDADILEIVVDIDNRKKGIGKKLFSATMNEIEAANKEKCTLEVASDNVAAKRLYEGAGFKQISVRKKYYPNGRDAIIYQKQLKL